MEKEFVKTLLEYFDKYSLTTQIPKINPREVLKRKVFEQSFVKLRLITKNRYLKDKKLSLLE